MPNRTRLLLPLALAAALVPLHAQSATRCVNPGGTGGCFARIADAIAASAFAGDSIAVAAGTYLEGNIVIDRSVNIAGAGAALTVVDGGNAGGNGLFDVFRVANNRVTATLSDLTMQRGSRGINVGGGNTVTLERVRVTANGPETGAGVFNGSSQLTVRNSTIDGNRATNNRSVEGCDWGGGSGGGLASLCGGGGNFIYGTTISGNYASRWGGGLIINDGVSVIENSTVSGNHADFADAVLGGGALFVGGAFPDITVRFSTLAGNTAQGTGGVIGASVDLASVKFYASILQNANGNCIPTPFPMTSLGYNVVSDASCVFSQPGDAASTSAMVEPLADNGGATRTQAIGVASPAVDRVPAAGCSVAADQTGVSRPQHGACDSGAYEHVFTAEELVTILAGEVAGVGPGGSLAAKVASALAYLRAGNDGAACSTLRALANEVRAQSGKKITAAQADDLLAAIAEIAALAGC
jgi:hypothetical protein